MQSKTKEKTSWKEIMKEKGGRKKSGSVGFVTHFELSFPSVETAFKKFKNIMGEDEGLQQIFSKGIEHFQVLQKRG